MTRSTLAEQLGVSTAIVSLAIRPGPPPDRRRLRRIPARVRSANACSAIGQLLTVRRLRSTSRSSAPRLEGFEPARWIAALEAQPTAATCHNDSIALGLFHGLTREGRYPGRNFVLIGHEDVEEASLVSPPTSVTRVSRDEMRKRAAAALPENPDAPPRRIVLKTELIVRGTCGVEASGTR